MKKWVILSAVLGSMLLLIFMHAHHGQDSGAANGAPDYTAESTPAVETPADAVESAQPRRRSIPEPIPPSEESNYLAAMAERRRLMVEADNIPVMFWGVVVDQDTNPIANVTVGAGVLEEYIDDFPRIGTKTTRLQKQTGSDGRFEISGFKGKFVAVYTLTKEGFEQELPGMAYGMYGPQVTSFEKPFVLTMWSTNLHEPLVSGEKVFVFVPDGRHYSVDLLKASLIEGDSGDIVVWAKRPEKVEPGQTYDWSCELSVPGGGLLERDQRSMYVAPETGYTNSFAYSGGAGLSGWGGMTPQKHFFVSFRKGQLYGRIGFMVDTTYPGGVPAKLRLDYAVNPSGSRLLR